eukprot:g4311.t1
MVSEAAKIRREDLIGNTFGWAYFGNAIAGILAGQIASFVASLAGPTAPFAASTFFLFIGLLLVLGTWEENYGDKGGVSLNVSSLFVAWKKALNDIWSDPKILLMGLANSSFIGGMYLFVLVWAPLISGASPGTASFPFGKAFACYMAACMIGSSLLGPLSSLANGNYPRLASFVGFAMLSGSLALAYVAYLVRLPDGAKLAGVFLLASCFALFEGVVGLYFPASGQLRARFIPSANRSVIMNLFRIPLNGIVIFGSLSIEQLGHSGVLSCGAASVGLSALCLLLLGFVKEGKKND